MQTFLPHSDFYSSLKVLDDKRLNAMRRESSGILTMLEKIKNGDFYFENQPLVLQWYGYEKALQLYRHYAQLEWVARGYKTSYDFSPPPILSDSDYPNWLGNDEYHLNQQLMLCRKAWQHENGLRGYKKEPLPNKWDYRYRWEKLETYVSVYTHPEFDYLYPVSTHYLNTYSGKFQIDDKTVVFRTKNNFKYLSTVILPDGTYYAKKSVLKRFKDNTIDIDRLLLDSDTYRI